MVRANPMIDAFERRIADVRMSVTDRCDGLRARRAARREPRRHRFRIEAARTALDRHMSVAGG
ncbi:MAG TPA: hypothetical protein VFK28_10165 [Sphingomicrobium sp.]|nr:hypothetical protein [Sphingomicrobium sp.]